MTSLTQGYLPSDQAGTGIRFVPVWLVETDAGSFLINGITREITAEKESCCPNLSNYEENLKISCCCIVIFLYIPAVVCYSRSGRIWLC